MKVVTRFAPSPTGALHLGGARTALFNYLFAKSQGGQFLLRVEDTDRARFREDALDSIIEGLNWLGISWNQGIVFQSKNAAEHLQVAQELIRRGRAYYCAQEQGKAIRLKTDSRGKNTLHDLVQGTIEVDSSELEDTVLIKSDGSPTYMLACVCDDHSMGISHIIRGTDHLTNSFLQMQIYQAMDWHMPQMAHIPLIHGPDGQKLSKRHGATSLLEYRDLGYLPEAVCNYLVRLGWSHKDEEIISREKMEKIFHIRDINKAPARLDFAKLQNLNAHYLHSASNEFLSEHLINYFERQGNEVDQTRKDLVRAIVPELKLRAKLLTQLEQSAMFLLHEKPLQYSLDAIGAIKQAGRPLIQTLLQYINSQQDFSKSAIETSLKELLAKTKLELKDVAIPLRALVTGTTGSLSIFSLISILGKEIICKRLHEGLELC